MNQKKKAILVTSIIGAVAAVFIFLGVFSLICESFVVNVISHIFQRLLLLFLFVLFVPRLFKDIIGRSMKKVTVLCGVVVFIDLVVVDAVRYILDDGIQSVLFLPACLPICAMAIMFYGARDTGRDKKFERVLTLAVCIPLLVIAVLFEVASFIK